MYDVIDHPAVIVGETEYCVSVYHVNELESYFTDGDTVMVIATVRLAYPVVDESGL